MLKVTLHFTEDNNKSLQNLSVEQKEKIRKVLTYLVEIELGCCIDEFFLTGEIAKIEFPE